MKTTKPANGERVADDLSNKLEDIAGQIEQIAYHLEGHAVEEDPDQLASTVLMFARAMRAERVALQSLVEHDVKDIRNTLKPLHVKHSPAPKPQAPKPNTPEAAAAQIGKLCDTLINSVVEIELDDKHGKLAMAEAAILFAKCIAREADALKVAA